MPLKFHRGTLPLKTRPPKAENKVLERNNVRWVRAGIWGRSVAEGEKGWGLGRRWSGQ